MRIACSSCTCCESASKSFIMWSIWATFSSIAIDASIGAKENLGMLCLSNSALYPGEGVAKSASPSGRNLYYRGHKLRRQSHSISPVKASHFLSWWIWLMKFINGTFYFFNSLLPDSALYWVNASSSDRSAFSWRRNQTYLNAACTADPFQRQAHILPWAAFRLLNLFLLIWKFLTLALKLLLQP